MAVINVDVVRAGNGAVEDAQSVKLGVVVHQRTVDHKTRELGVEAEVAVSSGRAEMVGVEGYDVVERLHNDGAVVEHHGPPVDERLIGHVVCMVIAVDGLQLAVFYIKAGNAVTGAYPDVVVVTFNHRMDDVVEHAVADGEHLRFRLSGAVKPQAVALAHPGPGAAVGKHAVDGLALVLRRRRLLLL